MVSLPEISALRYRISGASLSPGAATGSPLAEALEGEAPAVPVAIGHACGHHECWERRLSTIRRGHFGLRIQAEGSQWGRTLPH